MGNGSLSHACAHLQPLGHGLGASSQLSGLKASWPSRPPFSLPCWLRRAVDPHPLTATIRLLDPDGVVAESSGLLEFFYGGNWTPVATGGPSALTFRQSTANAICAQLGLADAQSWAATSTTLTTSLSDKCAGFTCGDSCFPGGWSENSIVQDAASWSSDYCQGNQVMLTCRWANVAHGGSSYGKLLCTGPNGKSAPLAHSHKTCPVAGLKQSEGGIGYRQV